MRIPHQVYQHCLWLQIINYNHPLTLLYMLYTQNRSRKVVQLCPQQASLPVGIGLLASRCLALHRSLGFWSKYLQCLILFKSLTEMNWWKL
jgi:hypothetical protein